MGWLQVFFGNRFGLQPHTCFQGFAAQIRLNHIGATLRIQQTLIVFVGEFGINGQPDRLPIVRAARQANGKVHPVFAARHGGVLGGVLIGRQNLLQQRRQLRLAKHAARFDIGQQMLEVAHALRQRVHFAQAFVHLLQTVGDLFEALAQARLQGGLQFFIHGLAHFVELERIALL